MKILDISDSLKIIQKHKKAEKSEVISRSDFGQTDRQTDIVNYRVATKNKTTEDRKKQKQKEEGMRKG